MKKGLIFLVAFLLSGCHASTVSGFSFTSTLAFKAASTPDRTLVIISDLHLGPGEKSTKEWYPTEDFRWPKALNSFLDEISRKGNHRVDLIIAGDFLEMWQPPPDLVCKGASSDLGCTVDEMKAIASWIVKAHMQTFDDLRKFSLRDDNRLYILPGNHDAALLISSVWEPIGKALKADGNHVNFIASGVWVSNDGRIVIEHGHQIGNEANRYDTWPNIVRNVHDKEYIIRPWGELFVQKVFNDEENDYPIIDNLYPESAGIRYRMEDRGLWGKASDMAEFVAFNLFQTSFSQKVQILGGENDQKIKPKWNITEARKIGHRLFIAALPEGDSFRTLLLEDSDKAKDTRRELDMLALYAKRLPDENVNMLCDHAAIQGNSVCTLPVLGAAIEKKLVPRERVLATHLKQKQGEFPKMRYFVYGHTHELEEAWPPAGVSYVQVLNTGAFQRVIDNNAFIKRISQKKNKKVSPGEGLRMIPLEELPPCYTYIRVPNDDGLPEPQVLRWVMKESDGSGRSVSPKDDACK
jgi:UDP-2,3-diacylglucosamine pyrophosphatase LpxH